MIVRLRLRRLSPVPGLTLSLFALACAPAFAPVRQSAPPVDAYQDRLGPVVYAVARTEGFYVAGTPAQAGHNPGALMARGGRYAVFNTDADGWRELRAWFPRHCGPLRRALKVYNPRPGYADYVIRLGHLDPNMEVCK